MSDEILISLQDRFAEGILTGNKTVELRRRALRVPKGTRVWIYAKQPTAQIRGYAILREVVEGTPTVIWQTLGRRAGISKEEFDDYFRGSRLAYALVLSNSKQATRPLSLERIRNRCSGFHPPQFFKRLYPGSTELNLLSQIDCG